MLIKFCGLRTAADVVAARDAGCDMAGFIVDVPESRRSISADEACEIASCAQGSCIRVGVFVDADPGVVASLVTSGAIDAVQLHGTEDDAYIAQVRRLIDQEGCATGERRAAGFTLDGLAADARAARTGDSPDFARDDPGRRWRGAVVKAFRIASACDVEAASKSTADLVLLDSGAGSGRVFPWGLLEGFPRPFLLAGGLTPDNVADACRAVRALAGENLIGVDMSSGIETNKVKDPMKMAAAVAKVRSIS